MKIILACAFLLVFDTAFSEGRQCGRLCKVSCEHGNVQDDRGCDTCTCRDPPDQANYKEHKGQVLAVDEGNQPWDPLQVSKGTFGLNMCKMYCDTKTSVDMDGYNTPQTCKLFNYEIKGKKATCTFLTVNQEDKPEQWMKLKGKKGKKVIAYERVVFDDCQETWCGK